MKRTIVAQAKPSDIQCEPYTKEHVETERLETEHMMKVFIFLGTPNSNLEEPFANMD